MRAASQFWPGAGPSNWEAHGLQAPESITDPTVPKPKPPTWLEQRMAIQRQLWSGRGIHGAVRQMGSKDCWVDPARAILRLQARANCSVCMLPEDERHVAALLQQVDRDDWSRFCSYLGAVRWGIALITAVSPALRRDTVLRTFISIWADFAF